MEKPRPVCVWSTSFVSVTETEVLSGLGKDVLTAEWETIQECLKFPFKRGWVKANHIAQRSRNRVSVLLQGVQEYVLKINTVYHTCYRKILLKI